MFHKQQSGSLPAGEKVKSDSEIRNEAPKQPWLNRNEWILFAITSVWFSVFAFFSVDLHHDGVMLKPAMDVAAGGVVFRDTFSQYGILSPLLQGAVVQLFGAELLYLRLLTVGCYGVCAILLDRLFRRFLSTPCRWGMFGFFLGLAPFYLWEMHIWSSVYALCCMLAGGVCMLRYLESGKTGALFLCGVAAAAAFGFRQPCGLVMIPAGLLPLGIEAWSRQLPPREWEKRIGLFLGGFGTLLAGYAVYLTVHGAWPDYFRQTWLFVSKFALTAEDKPRLLTLPGCLFPLRSAFVLFPLITLGLFVREMSALCRRRGESRRHLMLLAVLLVGLGSWHQYYPVPCYRHLYWAGIPMFGAFWLLVEQIGHSALRKGMRIALICLLLAWPLAEIGFRLIHGAERIASLRERESVSLPGVRWLQLDPVEAEYFRNLQQTINRIPPEFEDRLFLNLTPHALFCCFLQNHPDFRPMFVNWGNSVYPDYAEKAMKAVVEFQPLVISVAPEPFPGYRPLGGFPADTPFYYLSIPPEGPINWESPRANSE